MHPLPSLLHSQEVFQQGVLLLSLHSCRRVLHLNMLFLAVFHTRVLHLFRKSVQVWPRKRRQGFISWGAVLPCSFAGINMVILERPREINSAARLFFCFLDSDVITIEKSYQLLHNVILNQSNSESTNSDSLILILLLFLHYFRSQHCQEKLAFELFVPFQKERFLSAVKREICIIIKNKTLFLIGLYLHWEWKSPFLINFPTLNYAESIPP